MSDRHFKFWPDHAMRHLDLPATSVFYNLEVSARRHPDKPALIYYDTPITFREVFESAERMAGYLQRECTVHTGDRVALFMQNSPQFVIAYYGILRANAVVVPLNTMYLAEEFATCARDAGARTVIVSQELYPRIESLLERGGIEHVIIATYSDYLRSPTELSVPVSIATPRQGLSSARVRPWDEALGADLRPGPMTATSDDLCVMPYTSGTTGEPKGCMHTHGTAMHTLVASISWFSLPSEMTLLAVLPFFHVTGMQGSMNAPIYNGNTVVLLPRWDRVAAAACVQRYRISAWTAVPTMVQDFFSNPSLAQYDLSSIRMLSGGGAAMPAAIAQRLEERGVTYCEGYGLTETISPTHINPPDRPKAQCLGIPIYGVDSRVVDPVHFTELPTGEVGEIVTHGPQVFLGYWNKPAATAEAFIEIDGKRFLRTGDLGRVDEDGYFFLVDRLKRMINAAGFKVWPSEVESLMYHHPAVAEACVIGARDAHRGETVKALVVVREEWRGRVDSEAIIEWCRQQMATYKVPRIVTFVDALPKSGSGKIQWRELQEREQSNSESLTSPP